MLFISTAETNKERKASEILKNRKLYKKAEQMIAGMQVGSAAGQEHELKQLW